MALVMESHSFFIPDIKINIQTTNSQFDTDDLLFINGGTYSESIDANTPKRAFFPVSQWRPLNDVEIQQLSDTSNKNLRASVTITDIATTIQEYFWGYSLPKLLPLDKVDSTTKVEIMKELKQTVEKSLKNHHRLIVKSISTCDIAIHQPKSISTAFDHSSKSYLGLHIDNHEHLPYDKRNTGFLLLNINLGRSERYFNFVNLSVSTIIKALASDFDVNYEVEVQTIRPLMEKFLLKFPKYPVLRVRIKPNQAYIAVTQNIIHDGSTSNSENPDISCLLAGDFELK